MDFNFDKTKGGDDPFPYYWFESEKSGTFASGEQDDEDSSKTERTGDHEEECSLVSSLSHEAHGRRRLIQLASNPRPPSGTPIQGGGYKETKTSAVMTADSFTTSTSSINDAGVINCSVPSTRNISIPYNQTEVKYYPSCCNYAFDHTFHRFNLCVQKSNASRQALKRFKKCRKRLLTKFRSSESESIRNFHQYYDDTAALREHGFAGGGHDSNTTAC